MRYLGFPVDKRYDVMLMIYMCADGRLLVSVLPRHCYVCGSVTWCPTHVAPWDSVQPGHRFSWCHDVITFRTWLGDVNSLCDSLSQRAGCCNGCLGPERSHPLEISAVFHNVSCCLQWRVIYEFQWWLRYWGKQDPLFILTVLKQG